MEKPQYLVIGILAVAIGFFALRFTTDDEAEFSPRRGGEGDHAMARGDGSGYGGGGSRGDDGAGSRDRLAAGGRVSRFGSEGPRIGSVGAAGRGSAETATGGSRADRGRVGTGVGSRSGMRSAEEVGRAGSASNAIGGDRPSATSGTSRSDRLDALAGKEAAVDPFYEAKDLDDDPTDDIVLEVANKVDAEGKAEVLDGVAESDDGEWLEVGEDAQMAFRDMGNLNPASGTVSLDIVPNWNGADLTDNSLMQIREPHKWENRMQLVKNGQFLRFIFTDNTGFEADISHRIDNWVEGDAHRVTATWDNGVTTLYVDGRRVGTNSYPGALEYAIRPDMYLGSDLPNGGSYGGANAKLKAKLYDSAKGPDDII
jgi:hypothetical protein